MPRPDTDSGERWAVRHYRRGGAVARLLGDRYVRIGQPRPFREFRLSRALETLGVPTPRVVGAAVYPAGAFYRGDLVTTYVPGGVDLAGLVFGLAALPDDDASPAAGLSTSDLRGAGMDPGAGMAAAGRLVALLHTHGVAHGDLNIKNILVAADPDGIRAYILDLDAARLRARLSERARSRMLKRFWRSVAKWERRSGRDMPARLGERFREAYAAGLDAGSAAGPAAGPPAG